MGGGEMGQLEPNQKYVVVVEVYGKKTKAEGDEFDNELKKLMGKYGARIVYWGHASKRDGDPGSPSAR
jgi:hypothetical protein